MSNIGYIHKNGTAMRPKNACSYADIVAEYIDKKVFRKSHKVTYPGLGFGTILCILAWYRSAIA